LPKRKDKIRWEEINPLGKIIKLRNNNYIHVKNCHPDVCALYETARNTIKNPLEIWRDTEEKSKVWYYFNKVDEETCELLNIDINYIMVVVKQIQGEFLIASWYNVNQIGKKGAKKIWP